MYNGCILVGLPFLCFRSKIKGSYVKLTKIFRIQPIKLILIAGASVQLLIMHPSLCWYVASCILSLSYIENRPHVFNFYIPVGYEGVRRGWKISLKYQKNFEADGKNCSCVKMEEGGTYSSLVSQVNFQTIGNKF